MSLVELEAYAIELFQNPELGLLAYHSILQGSANIGRALLKLPCCRNGMCDPGWPEARMNLETQNAESASR
jgi:hypothetical protein